MLPMPGGLGYAVHEQAITGHLTIFAQICNLPFRRRVLVQGQRTEIYEEGLPKKVAGLRADI